MLSTSFIKIQSLELGLPETRPGKESSVAAEALIIDIGSDGALYWDHAPIALENFGMRVKDLLDRDPKASFLVRAGARVSVQKLVDTLDMIYALGGRYVAVDTLEEAEASSPAATDGKAAVPIVGVGEKAP